ncbi:MAG: TetR/AcrR family transcriptional regulator [Tabrizicola sp.]|uniref:TetR/AcrR family transcriptional regulator n=1 Tax=Tabrizicola sp. TaxID=2005166 RepID=UPI002AB7FC90|nr:TetR/AcrR family transcriptional regulator [Tabrizicola sp.]MDZ4087191.1 TetR/AcrR family transcriptional regulator [Tabrizicola sp.]
MTRKVQARRLATRDRLLAAGREIVLSSGLSGLRTEDVVQRAGTAKGTFFAHFVDRDHFLAALLAESLGAELAGLTAPQDREEVMRCLDRVYRLFAADAETVALLARFSGPAGAGMGLDQLICLVVERLSEGVARMQARGEVGSRRAPEVLAEALMAQIFHAAASAQCGLQGDAGAVRARADQLLVDMAEALLWPEG